MPYHPYSNHQRDYIVRRKIYKKPRQVPPPPKKCEIVETMTGRRREDTEIFPSRSKAKRALAKIIPTLPAKDHPEQTDLYWIRNI